MPDLLAFRREDEQAVRLREAFILIACDYGRLSDRSGWFEAPKAWQTAMRYLALGGYAEQDGSLFRWTTKTETAMRSAGRWDEDNRSLEALAEIELEAEADLAWQTMPDTLREAVRSSKIGYLGLVKVIAVSWRDGRWHDFNRDSHIQNSNAMRLAEALRQRAQK